MSAVKYSVQSVSSDAPIVEKAFLVALSWQCIVCGDKRKGRKGGKFFGKARTIFGM